jgi:hypothetical protein
MGRDLKIGRIEVEIWAVPKFRRLVSGGQGLSSGQGM